jgi:uncharacterized protein (TIGR03437 family)
VDGSANCTACHRTFAPANSDTRGSVRIDVASYTPGVKQVINVTVSHPDAARWGFEMTARTANDDSQTAGTFASTDLVRVICDDGSLRGTLAPCPPGQHAFAQHNDAPRTSPGQGFTFSFEWTPPSSDVGDIIFYVAGNAANGDGTNNGDRIYTAVRRISAPCKLTQKPIIDRLANAASLQPAWSGNALVSLFGSNFGPADSKRPVSEGDIDNRRYPQSLACTAVTINGQNAPVMYVQPDQINLQAPQVAGGGRATVIVIANPGGTNELRSDPVSFDVQAFSPAFFTLNGRTIAATSADGSTLIADPSVASGAAPARPGDTVVLYATGLGATNPQVGTGDISADQAPAASAVTVTIGGTALPAADVLYAGATPLSIGGLQQIRVRLPASLADGDVAVLISVGGVQSPAGAVIPVKR